MSQFTHSVFILPISTFNVIIVNDLQKVVFLFLIDSHNYEGNLIIDSRLLNDYFITGFPVAQHWCNAKVMGSIPRESKS